MDYIKNLVSVLTPCYNASKNIHRLLESVLSQSYPNIEMTVIDDGSTDNSIDVIRQYIPQFEAKGYSLYYVHQENQGQSVAIRNGLKLIHGEFLVWPDSDDFYASDEAISIMVSEFRKSSDTVGMVRTKAWCIEDSEEIKIIGEVGKEYITDKERIDLFEDCLFVRNGFYFAAGAYMIKTELINETMIGDIYTEKDAGQNWQLMLPYLYNYDCKTIQKKLYYITERADSHSRGTYKGYEAVKQKFNSYERTLLATLDNIKNLPEGKKQQYKDEIRKKYVKEDFVNAFYNDNIFAAKNSFKLMMKDKNVKLRDTVLLFICMFRIRKPLSKLKKALL